MTTSEKPVRRQDYERLKQRVRLAEKTNYSRLILFESGDEWLKMGGNSLLIYYYDIAKRSLKEKPNILPDTDYTKTIFEDGIISFFGTNAIEKKLKKAGVLKEKIKRDGGVIFELNFSVSEKEIKAHLLELQLEKRRALEVLNPKIMLEPEIYECIRSIQKRIFETVRNTTSFERDYNGLKLCEFSLEICRQYNYMNLGRVKEPEGWDKILDLIDRLSTEITFVIELKIWSQDTSVAVATKLVQLKRLCERKLKNVTSSTGQK